MNAYRTAPVTPPRPPWWRRLLARLRCALTWHVLTSDTIAAWLAGEIVRCPRCGAVRDYSAAVDRDRRARDRAMANAIRFGLPRAARPTPVKPPTRDPTRGSH